MADTVVDIKNYTIPNTVPVCKLECKAAFDGLQEKEKQYSHYLSRACHEGALIVLLQTSPESPAIFLLLQKLFSGETVNSWRANAVKDDITEDDFKSLLTFAAGFYSNMGNYKSFGDTKIIPAVSKDKMKCIIWSSQAYKKDATWIESVWNDCSDSIYSLSKRRRELGLGEKGVSTYYSSNINEEDVTFIQDFMKEKKLSPYNSRLFKIKKGDTFTFEVRLASAALSEKFDNGDTTHSILGESVFRGKEIKITRGDYSDILKRVSENLAKAKENAVNENEVQMLENYIKCFNYGSVDAHKDGSRYWIKNQRPIVETYIGFIESYRDPYGVRGEYEGFVSMVNKEMSAKFEVLVSEAKDLLSLMPWPTEYEKDTFLTPDFTSLDVLSFAGSGIPAGINIPNYDDIRQDEGFKNVSLGNVLQAYAPDQKITFLNQEDQDMYRKLKYPSFEVQVGLHELLGHGSGKLFKENKDGILNFDKDDVYDLETNIKILSWYGSDETYDTKFSSLASSYEECRAECVGIYLCLDKKVLKIFGHEGQDADNIIYINWLNMVRAGLLGLEFYSPETELWKQAHMNARYVILQVLLEAGEDLVNIEERYGDDGQPDLRITINNNKIANTGKLAICNFLKRLQLYKATANIDSARSMYDKYSKVAGKMLEYRSIVMARKQPRKLFVQLNTKIIGDSVNLLDYKASCEGLIESNIDRYLAHDIELETLWQSEKNFHHY